MNTREVVERYYKTVNGAEPAMRETVGADRGHLPPYGPQAAADDFVVEWQLLPPPTDAGPPAVSEAGSKLHPGGQKHSRARGFSLDNERKP